jgi:excisionase family DNA binding protein
VEEIITNIITATIPNFCRITGIGRSKTYELLDDDTLESIKIGRRRLIILDSYHKLIERQRAAGATARTGESQSPAPQAKDVAVETTGAHPPPPVAGKGAPLNFERYHACNKNTEFSSARRNADEGAE